jgi:uncharacterized protein (DUF2267 family)
VVDYEQFLELVQRWSGLDRASAERAVRATLRALRDRLSPGVARAVAASLPAEVLADLHTTRDAERFDVDEFLARIAASEGVDIGTAERHARAVLLAIRRALPPDQFERLAADLPDDIRALLEPVTIISAQEFLQRVAERAGLDVEEAARATVAVLETLAERIAGGEVHDLITRLPVELHEPLKRGGEQRDRPARRMSVDEFVLRVAARERVSPEQAPQHIRAVLEALREAVGEEYFDVRAQLPPEYTSVLP